MTSEQGNDLRDAKDSTLLAPATCESNLTSALFVLTSRTDVASLILVSSSTASELISIMPSSKIVAKDVIMNLFILNKLRTRSKQLSGFSARYSRVSVSVLVFCDAEIVVVTRSSQYDVT